MRDKRYNTIKVLIETGNVSQLTDIFDTLPKTVLSRDIGLNYARFLRKVAKPQLFTLQEIYKSADVIGVERGLLLNIIDAQASKDYKKGKLVK